MRLIGSVAALTLLTPLAVAGDARRGVETTKPEAPASSIADPQTAEADERIARLEEALADTGAKVRREAISELVDMGGEEAAAALTATALFDEDPSLRVEAVYGLGEIGGQTSSRILEGALLDADPEVREAAIDAVIDIGGEESAWTLAIALNGEDTVLREQAVHALGEIGGELAIVILKQALADEETSIREAAAAVLAELGQKSSAATDGS